MAVYKYMVERDGSDLFGEVEASNILEAASKISSLLDLSEDDIEDQRITKKTKVMSFWGYKESNGSDYDVEVKWEK